MKENKANKALKEVMVILEKHNLSYKDMGQFMPYFMANVLICMTDKSIEDARINLDRLKASVLNVLVKNGWE